MIADFSALKSIGITDVITTILDKIFFFLIFEKYINAINMGKNFITKDPSINSSPKNELTLKGLFISKPIILKPNFF
jgi:hypothetical protein